MNEREACARARELSRAIAELLAGVGADQEAAASVILPRGPQCQPGLDLELTLMGQT